MPIEIRELHIKASIDGAGNESGSATGSTQEGAGANQDELVKVCVDKVLEVLREKLEK